MKALSTVLRLVAILCAAIAVVVFFLGKNQLREQQAETLAARQALTAKQAELAATAERLDTAEASLQSEREALSAAKRNLESVRSEMLTARQELTRTREELSRAKTEISELNGTAASLRAEIVDRERQLASAAGSGAENQMKERIAELEAETRRLSGELSAALNTRLAAPEGAAAMTAAPATRTGPSPLQPATVGKSTVITSISRDAGILILDGGRNLGLAEGMEVTLVSDLQAVCKVRIGKIADTYTVANILPGSKTKGLSQGMTVSILR